MRLLPCAQNTFLRHFSPFRRDFASRFFPGNPSLTQLNNRFWRACGHDHMGPSFSENEQEIGPKSNEISQKCKSSTTMTSAAQLASGKHRYARITHG